MDRLAAGRDGARGLAARVERVLALVVLRLVRRGLDAGADVGPRAVVEGLLLAPEDVRVGVLVEVRSNLFTVFSSSSSNAHTCCTYQVIGEGRNLLDPADSDIVDALVLTLLEEGVVDLACKRKPTSIRHTTNALLQDIPVHRIWRRTFSGATIVSGWASGM